MGAAHVGTILCLLAVAIVMSMPAPVEAQAEAQAQAAFLQGQQLAEARQFALALEQYREANRLAPDSPAPLLGIGLCLTELGQNREALDMLDRYLDRGRNPQSRQQAQEAIERVTRPLEIGTIRLTVAPSNATVTVDGREIPAYRFNRIRVNGGSHAVIARLAGYADARREVRVRAGQAVSVTLNLSHDSTPAPDGGATSGTSAQPTPTPRRSVARRWWFWTIIGAVVVGSGLAVGLTLGLDEEPPNGDWRLELP